MASRYTNELGRLAILRYIGPAMHITFCGVRISTSTRWQYAGNKSRQSFSVKGVLMLIGSMLCKSIL